MGWLTGVEVVLVELEGDWTGFLKRQRIMVPSKSGEADVLGSMVVIGVLILVLIILIIIFK
jgi:hypothetical protein